jgi:hypothetical protein
MSTPLNPLTNPLAQVTSFQPLDEIPVTGGPVGNAFGPADQSGNSTPGASSSQTASQLGQMLNPFSSGPSASSAVSQTVSTTVLSYLFTSRFVLFILGIICVIAGLYLLKPGPVTTIVQAPVKAAKAVVKAGAEATAAA